MEASLCLVAAERPQWPRVYLLGRLRSCSPMPSLVGDSGQVLGVLGWALTRICNLPSLCRCVHQWQFWVHEYSNKLLKADLKLGKVRLP